MKSKRTEQQLLRLKKLYNDGDLPMLLVEPEGLFFLKLRSVERKESLQFVAKYAQVEAQGSRNTDVLRALFLSDLDEETLEKAIRAIHDANATSRAERANRLAPELVKLRSLDWGGVHSNDINRHIVDRYVKKIENFDDLERAIETELAHSVRSFTLSSWFNTWTSVLIEEIFNDHPEILPAVGQIKMIDFFWKGLPFDLKVTYFPDTFMQKRRKEKKLPADELTQLKKIASKFKLPFDKNQERHALKSRLLTLIDSNPNTQTQAAYAELRKVRFAILQETMQHKKDLIRWLYENQGTQRFDASNRLFLVLIDPENLDDSWKLKGDLPLLRQEINSYLNQTSLRIEDMEIGWEFKGQPYKSYADILFITTGSSPVQ